MVKYPSRFLCGQVFCFPKLWLLQTVTPVLFCCRRSVLPCTAVNSSMETLLFGDCPLSSGSCFWQDRSLSCPCHLLQKQRKENKTEKLQTNAANSTHARALLGFLCLLGVAQVSQKQQPQTSEQSGRWAPEDAALPLGSGDLAVSHLLCSLGAWFSYWLISKGISWVLKEWSKMNKSDELPCSATKSTQHSKVTCALLPGCVFQLQKVCIKTTCKTPKVDDWSRSEKLILAQLFSPSFD